MDVRDDFKAFWWHVRALTAHVVSRNFDLYRRFRIGVIKNGRSYLLLNEADEISSLGLHCLDHLGLLSLLHSLFSGRDCGHQESDSEETLCTFC